MSQSRLSSFIETYINIVIGFAINFVLNLWLIPNFVTGQDGQAVHITLVQNWWLGVALTFFSVIRMYVIRRWFNARLHSFAERLAGGAA